MAERTSGIWKGMVSTDWAESGYADLIPRPACKECRLKCTPIGGVHLAGVFDVAHIGASSTQYEL